MSGIVFGVVTLDPITGEPNSMQADIDWNFPTAAVVAEALGGQVFAAERGPWMPVDPAMVAEVARQENEKAKDDNTESELQNLLSAETAALNDPDNDEVTR